MSDRTLLQVGLAIGGVIVGLQLVILYLKWRIYTVTVSYLRRSEAHNEQSAEILGYVKLWSNSAHIQHKDTKRLMDKVEAREDAAAAVIQAVETVPDRTADKVVEKIAAAAPSDSGAMRIPHLPSARGEA